MEMQIIFRKNHVYIKLDKELQNLVSMTGMDEAVRNGLEKVGPHAINEEAKNFIAGGRPTWKPLVNGSPSFLYDTGALREAVEMGSIIEVGDEWVEVTTGPGVPYAAAANAIRPYNVIPDGEPMENLADAFIKGVKEKLEV